MLTRERQISLNVAQDANGTVVGVG